MITKKFNTFVWEEELQSLGMPYFYLGIKTFIISSFVYFLHILFTAFIFLGIGKVISIIVFICEKV